MSYPGHSLGGILPLCRGEVSVIYSPSQLGKIFDLGVCLYIYIYIYLCSNTSINPILTVQSAETEEYADYIAAEAEDSLPNEYPRYDSKPSDYEASVSVPWEMWRSYLLPGWLFQLGCHRCVFCFIWNHLAVSNKWLVNWIVIGTCQYL